MKNLEARARAARKARYDDSAVASATQRMLEAGSKEPEEEDEEKEEEEEGSGSSGAALAFLL